MKTTETFRNKVAEYIENNSDRFVWARISHMDVSEDFIRKFQNKVYWSAISYSQTLSEQFIREFQDKVDWYFISSHQKLSENFIMEFQHKVNWNRVLYFQILSESFKQKIRTAYEIISNTEEECSICLSESDYQFIKTRCNHIFHKECIDVWLNQHNSCPFCRQTVRLI